MNKQDIIQYGLIGIGCAAFLITICQMFFTVEQQHVYIVERFGKFIRIAEPGLNTKIPFIDSIEARIGLQVFSLSGSDNRVPKVSTKTKDDVTVNLLVEVQYAIIPGREKDAHYLLDNPQGQMFWYLLDSVRAKVPTMTLDAVFEEKESVASVAETQLKAAMLPYGYDIKKVLVAGIDPDDKVQAAMNEINAAQRLRIAASEKGEAERILTVKQAEASAQSMALEGKGLADKRQAIIHGLQAAVVDFQTAINGATAQDVMNLVLITQYLDTLKELGGKSNTIMLPHSPGAIGELADQLRATIISANKV